MPLANFLDEADRILQVASEKGIVLRLIGALGIKKHLTKYGSIHESLGRELSDIDFVSLSKNKSKTEKLFAYLGYMKQRSLGLTAGIARREIFIDDTNKRFVDIFYDKLVMNHTIDFSNRLEVDYPTVPLAELFLSKMQIVKITDKDLKDTAILLLEHEIGEKDSETINTKVITKTLSRDWGFYYTVTTNLEKLKTFIPIYKPLTEGDKTEIMNKADRLTELIENEPKSFKWKMRSKIGTKQTWYTPVETRL